MGIEGLLNEALGVSAYETMKFTIEYVLSGVTNPEILMDCRREFTRMVNIKYHEKVLTLKEANTLVNYIDERCLVA